MSTAAVIVFGRLDRGVWGAAWIQRSGGGTVVFGTPGETSAVEVSVEGNRPEEEWRLRGDRLDLRIVPASDALLAGDGENESFEQLCRVSGSVGEHRVESLGRRAVHAAIERFESIRDVSAWFEEGSALSLVAARPPRARGHETDVVDAVMFDAGAPSVSVDPRLSTTYDEDGLPARAGLELWFGEDEEDQFTRRAAGEAASPTAIGVAGAVSVRARLFRWHSRGQNGSGVYLLATRG